MVVLAVKGQVDFHIEGVRFGHHAVPQPIVSLVGKIEVVHLPAQAGEVYAQIHVAGYGTTVLGDPGAVFRRYPLLEDLQFDGNVVPLK